MSELFHIPDTPEEDKDNGYEDAYYDHAVSLIMNGEPVWVMRNLDQGNTYDSGQVWDFFANKKPQGFVDDEGDGNYRVYRYSKDAPEGDGVFAVGDTTSLDEAKSLLASIVETRDISEIE